MCDLIFSQNYVINTVKWGVFTKLQNSVFDFKVFYRSEAKLHLQLTIKILFLLFYL